MHINNSLQKEKVFHDAWAGSIDIDEVKVDESFEACTAAENRLILQKLGDITNKRILDLGCGAGEAAVYFATRGADVTGLDISQSMLKITQEVAKKYNVYVYTKQSAAEAIDFEDCFFDIVYAANLLHHVDIEKTLSEASRVLKKGGIFVSWDPLLYNPIIKIYRKIATTVRTEGEHPIKMEDLGVFRRYFSHIEVHTTWFFTLWIFIKFYLVDRLNPNQIRYWKKILHEHKKLEKTYNKLEKIDKLFLKCFPFMKRYCWNIIILGFK